MLELKASLLDIARQTNQRPGELLAGIEQIVDKTGNLDFAVGSIRNMGIVASATGADMADVGAIASNLNEKLDISKDELLSIFDIWNEQGKTGAFRFDQMAQFGERFLTAAASYGMKGKQGARELGAFLQIARTGTGSADMAVTATERVFADMIHNRKKIKALTGFSIIDEKESKRQGRAVFKDFGLVMKEIIKRTKGDTIKLRAFFNEESIRAVDAYANAYKKTGDFRVFDDLVQRGGDGRQIMEDFGVWSAQTAAHMTRLNAELDKLSNQNLAGPIEKFTKALDYLNNHPLVLKGGIGAVVGFGALVFFKNVYDVMEAIYKVWRKVGGKEAPTAPEGQGRVPEAPRAVETPSSSGGGAPSRAGGAAMRLAGWTTWAAILVEAYKELSEGLNDLAFKTPEQRKENARQLTNRMTGIDPEELYARLHRKPGAGKLDAQKTLPPPANPLAGMKAEEVNALFKSAQPEIRIEVKPPEVKPPEVKNEVNINLTVPQSGPVIGSTTDKNTTVNLRVDDFEGIPAIPVVIRTNLQEEKRQ
jgi:hypothetical protein